MEDERYGTEPFRPRLVPGPRPSIEETLKAFSRVTDLPRLRKELKDIEQIGGEGIQRILDVIAERIKQLEPLDAAAIAELKAVEEAEDRAEALQAESVQRARARAEAQAAPAEVIYIDDLIDLDEDKS